MVALTFLTGFPFFSYTLVSFHELHKSIGFARRCVLCPATPPPPPAPPPLSPSLIFSLHQYKEEGVHESDRDGELRLLQDAEDTDHRYQSLGSPTMEHSGSGKDKQ